MACVIIHAKYFHVSALVPVAQNASLSPPKCAQSSVHCGYIAPQSDSIVKSPFSDSIARPISGMNTTGRSPRFSPAPSA